MKKTSTVRVNGNMIFKGHKLTIGLDLGDHLRCSPSFGPKSGLLKVDRCLQYIIERSLLLGLWEL